MSVSDVLCSSELQQWLCIQASNFCSPEEEFPLCLRMACHQDLLSFCFRSGSRLGVPVDQACRSEASLWMYVVYEARREWLRICDSGGSEFLLMADYPIASSPGEL
jgi:hypothetical protein